MTLTRRRVAVLVLATLMMAGAVFAGTSAPGVVDDANAIIESKAGGAE